MTLADLIFSLEFYLKTYGPIEVRGIASLDAVNELQKQYRVVLQRGHVWGNFTTPLQTVLTSLRAWHLAYGDLPVEGEVMLWRTCMAMDNRYCVEFSEPFTRRREGDEVYEERESNP